LLTVRNLKVDFDIVGRRIRVIHGVDLDVGQSETVGLVGESGCGKSVTCMAFMRLLGERGHIYGTIEYKDFDILSCNEIQMRKIRGKEISMIFQEPVMSLNPVQRVGKQIREVLQLHGNYSTKQAFARAVSLFEQVGIAEPESRLRDYPHQLSGGLCQRVMIAMALAGEPSILIADEPSTALDVTVQAQILELIRDLNKKLGMATILVTHDLGVIAENVERVLVMYAGLVVEEADVDIIFSSPLHPYTLGLLNSLPAMGVTKKDLIPIEGVVPAPDKRPPGCCFQPRCAYSTKNCVEEQPALTEINIGHKVACFHPVYATS
jgi:oligopeptide/dipeptide ABC transporter ATP-binding protein